MRECRCPGTPHSEGDFAYLKPRADLAIGLAAESAIGMSRGELETRVNLGLAYVRYGIASWDLLDEHGKPVPVETGIDELGWEDLEPVAEKANDLYSENVLRPLLARQSKMSSGVKANGTTPPSSPLGQTVELTSAKKRSSASRHKRS